MNDKKLNLPLFTLAKPKDIKWPVVVRLPVDGGETAEYQFTGVFARKSEQEYADILGAAPEGLPVREILERNALLFPQLMTGWEGITYSAGTEAAFTPELLAAQITGPNGQYLSAGLWVAIAEIRSGARLGN